VHKYFRVLNFQAPQSSSFVCHNLFARILEGFEFLSSSKVTLFYLLKFVHKYVKVLNSEALPKFMFYLPSVVYLHEVWKFIVGHILSITICASNVSGLHYVLKLIKGHITKFPSVLFQNQILYIVNQSGNGRSD